MKALTRKDLIALKAVIKGLAAESQDIRRKYILPNHGSKRDYAWCEKRALGHYTRVHLLAYALMRGLDRNQLEKINPRNNPAHSQTYYHKALAKEIYQVCRSFGTYRVHWTRELNEEAIVAWLHGEKNEIFERPVPPDPGKLRLKSLVQRRLKMSGQA